MSWLSAVPVVLVASALLFLPGGSVVRLLGFRWMAVVGCAPLASVSIVGVAEVVASLLRIPWGPGVMLAATVLALACSCVLRRFIGLARHGAGGAREWVPSTLAATAGIVAATAAITLRFIGLTGDPGNIAQGIDNVFHLNAVRHILDTGDASSLTLGALDPGMDGLVGVYPAAWHGFAALLCQLTGSSIPVAVNSLNLAVAALVWPTGAVFLTRVLFGRGPAALLTAGAVSGAFYAFPFLLLEWGPLYPFVLALGILPAALSIVIMLCREAKDLDSSRPALWILLIASIPALAFAHTSTLNTLLIVALPLFVAKTLQSFKALRARQAPANILLRAGLITVFGLFALQWVWLNLRPGWFNEWEPHTTTLGGIREVLLNAPLHGAVPWTVSLLVLTGLIFVIHRGRYWIAGSYALLACLYVIAASTPNGFLRGYMLSNWYQDTYRMAALLPLLAVPLAGAAGQWMADAAVRLLQRTKGGFPARVPTLGGNQVGVAALTVAALLAVAAQSPALTANIGANRSFYTLSNDSVLLSSDELRLIQRLPTLIPRDALIADNPWNGSSLAYALTGRRTLVTRLFPSADPRVKTISTRLNEAAKDPETCNALRSLNVSYVLDFGNSYLSDGAGRVDGTTGYEGLQNLAASDSVQPVAREGQAVLYRVTACRT